MQDTPDRQSGRPETILAFDFGLRRIGVAVGQSITQSASPIGAVACKDGAPEPGKIEALIAEWRPTRLVVGMPTHADGSPSTMQAHVKTFIALLDHFALPVDTVDERFTSVEAETTLKNARAAGTRGRIRKEDIDAAAAVAIAERYLRGS